MSVKTHLEIVGRNLIKWTFETFLHKMFVFALRIGNANNSTWNNMPFIPWKNLKLSEKKTFLFELIGKMTSKLQLKFNPVRKLKKKRER